MAPFFMCNLLIDKFAIKSACIAKADIIAEEIAIKKLDTKHKICSRKEEALVFLGKLVSMRLLLPNGV